MRYFERDNKYNWVDENNVFVGFDNQSQCCERFGYFITKDENIALNEPDPNGAEPDLTNYRFDVSYFKENNVSHEESRAVFKLNHVNGGTDLYLVLYNSHNGYYSHGFECSVGGLRLYSGRL